LRRAERPDDLKIEVSNIHEQVSVEEIELVQKYLGNIILEVIKQASIEEDN